MRRAPRTVLAVHPLERRDTPAGLFDAPATITDANLGPDTTVLAVADFNGDGKLDFAVTNYGSSNPSTVSVALGTGTGTFAAAAKFTVDASAGNRAPEGVVALDADGDADLDLAVVLNEGSTNNVVIMTNDGTGKFTAGQVLTAGTNATHVVAGDFNGDGRGDLAVSNYGGGVSVFLNQPAGGFAAAVTVSSGGTGGNVIVAADFDGDADLDLAVANQIDGTVGVLLNNGAGGFALAGTLDAGQLGTTFLAAGDLNEDGAPDLVASNTFDPTTNTTGNTIRAFFNTGGGTFAAQPPVTVDPAPTGVVIRDFNGDQLPDVVFGVSSTGEVAALMNNGGGNLLGQVPYAAITGANGLGAGDFNGDGRPDLAVTQYDSGDAVAVLANGLVGTTVTLAGPATSEVGTTPTFTATVTPASGGPVTTGFVSFLDGDDYLTTVAVTNGTASYAIPGLTAGAHAIRAIYSDAVDLTWFGDEATPLAHAVSGSTSTAAGVLAVGASNGSVRLVDAATGAVVAANFRPLDAPGGAQYTGLVSVALGDLNGDTVADVWVAAASPAGVRGLAADKAGRVFVYDGAALLAGTPPALLHTFTPFATTSGPGGTSGPYVNGLNIAAGDVDGNGSVELIAGTRGNVGAAGLVEYGRMVVVQAGTDADGSDDSNIGSTFTPFGPTYQKGVVVAVGDLDGDTAAEVAVTRGGPVAPGNPNKSIKLKVFRFTGQDLEELDLNGPAAGAFAPFQGAVAPGGVLERDARVALVDPDGDGLHALVVTALDPLSAPGDVRVRVAAFAVDTGTGLATLTSTGPGGGAAKSYLVGTGVLNHAIAAVGVSGSGASNLALITQSAASGVAYLDPLSGAALAGGFGLSVLGGGVTIDGV
ncbi:beta strand repeat-containing protein [Gemmata sp.]|uniref:beta strand repeat-containing protein n=1 Tax=Gemmata sp. TaxID=1914242 RepID=UPI003F708898